MRRFKAVLVVLLFFSAVIAANAQIMSRETGALKGLVLDADGIPLPGVNLTLTSPAMMGTSTDVSRPDGAFRFILLPPGTYVILAELKGFKTVRQENIEIRLGSTVTLNVTMPVATVEEEITVVGTAPQVDVKASTTEVLLKAEMLQNLPIGRNLASVITLTPGTVNSSNVKGSTAAGNTYSVDGLNANDPCQQQLAIPINFNLMDEVEVMTGGMPAEVGTTSGGFVNVITRSGGNKFSGLVQAYYTNKDLTGAVLPLEELAAMGIGKPASAVFSWDVNASVGGPILKDKLWFYASGVFGKSKNLTTFIPYTAPNGVYYDNDFDVDAHNFSAFLKLTYQLSKSLKFSVMGNMARAYDNTRNNSWWIAFDMGQKDDPWANDALTAAANWVIDPNTFLEVRGGYANVDATILLTRPELTDVTWNYDGYTGYYWGTGYRGPNEWTGRPSYQVSAHLTRFQDNFLGGDHELKAGVEVQTGADKWAIWKNNPLQMFWYDGSPYAWTAQYGDWIRPYYGDGYIGMELFGPDEHGYEADANFLKLGFYLQDSFTIQNRLTVNLGLRYDVANGWLPDIHHSQAGGWAYELGEFAIAPYTTGNFNPYAAFDMPGVDNLVNWTIFSPRIGLTYDLFGDGKTAVKVHYGIYGDNIWASFFEFVHPLRWKTFYFNWWDENGNGLADAPSQGDYYELNWWWGNPETMLRENWITGVSPNIKAPYDHQVVVGIDHELFKNFKVGLNYMYKHHKNMVDDALMDLDTKEYWYNPNTSPGDQYWVPFTTTVPAVGTSFPEQTVTMYFMSNDAPSNYIYQVTNIPEAYRKYSGIELTFEKRMANGWQLGGSLNYSKIWGNVNGGYGDIHGYASSGDGANWWVNWGGRTAEDRPIVIKLFGSFNLPFGFLASFYYQAVSGTPWARTVTVQAPLAWAEANNVNIDNTYTVPLELNGARRYNTWQNTDFRLEKEFKLGNYGKVGIFADVFNLFGNHYVNVNQNPGGTWMPDDNNSDTGRYILSGTFKKVTGFSQLTRTVRLSVRYTF